MDRPDDQSERDDAGTGAQRDDLQLNIPTQQAAESETVLPLSISQEEIDNVLLRGSLVSDGKYRIFEQFQKQETTKENAAFLKKEYGIGGYAAPGSPMVNFRGKGIEIISNDSNRKIDLSWNQAAIRIQQLIEANRYFTPLEAERYAEYISAKTSVPETSMQDMKSSSPFRSMMLNSYWDINRCLECMLLGNARIKPTMFGGITSTIRCLPCAICASGHSTRLKSYAHSRSATNRPNRMLPIRL